MGTSGEHSVHSYYPFYYVMEMAEMGIFDRLRESAGANDSLGRKSCILPRYLIHVLPACHKTLEIRTEGSLLLLCNLYS